MYTEAALVKAVPEVVRNRPAPQSTLFKGGTPLQQIATWFGPPTDPPGEVEEMEVEDANPPRNTRERTLIIKMESYLQKSEELQVGISELEYFLLGPGDEDISVASLKENARDEAGSKVVLLDTRRAKEVADTARFGEAAWKQKPGSKSLEEEVNRRQDAMTQMEKDRRGLLETSGREPQVKARLAGFTKARRPEHHRAERRSSRGSRITTED